MRITALHIQQFGLYANQTLENLSPELTVFAGLNEAGKSTLLGFLRAMPYGFETRQSRLPRYVDEESNVVQGGWIEFETRSGHSYRLARGTVRRRQTGKAELIDLQTHAHLDPDELPGILRAPREAFYSVYAFSLRELQEFSELTADQVQSRIWSAGMGHAQAPVAGVIADLDARRRKLYTPGASVRPLNDTLGRLRGLRDRLHDAQRRRDAYEVARVDLDQLREEAERLATEARCLETDQRWLVQCRQAWQPWVQLQGHRAALEALPPPAAFPAQGLERLRGLQADAEALETQAARLTDETAEVDRARAGLTLDERLEAQRGAIGALGRQVSDLEGLLRDLPKVRAEVEVDVGQLARRIGELSPGRDEAWLNEVDVSVPLTAEAREYEERLRHLGEVARAEQRELDAVEEAARVAEVRHTDAVRALPEPPSTHADALRQSRDALAAARRALGDQLAAEADRRHAADRVQDHERQRAALDSQRVSDTTELPAWAVIATAGLLVIGSLALRPNAVGVVVGLVLAALVLAVGFAVRRRQRQGAQVRRAAADAQLETLDEAIQGARASQADAERRAEAATRQLQACAEGLGAAVAGPADLEAAERRLEALRGLLEGFATAQAAVAQAARDLTEADRRRAKAEGARDKALAAWQNEKRSWSTWVVARGFPEEPPPGSFLELAQGVQRLRDTRGRIEEKRTRVIGMTRDLAGITTDAAAALQACGRPVPGQAALPGVIDALVQELGRVAEERIRAEELDRNRQRLALDLERARERLTEVNAQIAELLAQAGAPDLEAFLGLGERHAQRTGLQEQAAAREEQVALIVGVGPDRERLDRELPALNEGALTDMLREAQERLAAARTQREDALRRLVERETEIRELEASAEIAALVQEEANATSLLRDQVDEYGPLACASVLLSRARRQYEKTSQPPVISRAGAYLRTITGGRYSDLVSPLGRPGELEALDAQGTPQPLTRLSTGTQQQLYLAVRLAYLAVHHAAPHAEPLPLVMDEVLVNFDPVRARRSAELIRELAREGNQVLVFTCHPETVDLFREVDPGVAVVELVDGAIRPLAEEGNSDATDPAVGP